MLRTGQDYLDGLRDGRVVYVGAERITDVVSHPGFRGAAQTIAEIYDLKFNAAFRKDLVVEEGDGAPYSAYFLAPQTRDDLEKRFRCHKIIAEVASGLFGRAPDHVASLITGLAMETGALADQSGRLSQNLFEYYRSARERDAYAVYAVLPNSASYGARSDRRAGGTGLRVVHEDDSGVVLSGVKALATAAMLADEIWIGNMQPIGDQEMEAITCVVPCNATGLQLWSRQNFAPSATSEFDSPLTWRFDEGDAILIFDNVKVDWCHVFTHRDPLQSSEIYLRTPAHCLANHQSCVRSLSKVRLLVGLANRIARLTCAAELPAVIELLGRFAALEATLAGLLDAQVQTFESWPSGGVSPNRRYVYAALNWCQEFFPVLINSLRELMGSGNFRFPASIEAINAPELRPTFEQFWGNARGPAVEQMQLLKLGWDLIGSEFAGRQQQYERFYAGPPFVVRGHSHREASWDDFDAAVTRLMSRCQQRSPDLQRGANLPNVSDSEIPS